jgi:hypothetical protein
MGEVTVDVVLATDGLATGGDSVTYGKGLSDGSTESRSSADVVVVGAMGGCWESLDIFI